MYDNMAKKKKLFKFNNPSSVRRTCWHFACGGHMKTVEIISRILWTQALKMKIALNSICIKEFEWNVLPYFALRYFDVSVLQKVKLVKTALNPL